MTQKIKTIQYFKIVPSRAKMWQNLITGRDDNIAVILIFWWGCMHEICKKIKKLVFFLYLNMAKGGFNPLSPLALGCALDVRCTHYSASCHTRHTPLAPFLVAPLMYAVHTTVHVAIHGITICELYVETLQFNHTSIIILQLRLATDQPLNTRLTENVFPLILALIQKRNNVFELTKMTSFFEIVYRYPQLDT